MRVKKSNIFICIMLVLTILIMIEPSNIKVKANPDNGGDISLDYQYIYNITNELSEVIFNPDVYGQDELEKGRAFGSTGEHYSATDILKPEMINLGLINPGLDPSYLDEITNLKWYPLKKRAHGKENLTDKIDIIARRLIINDTK